MYFSKSNRPMGSQLDQTGQKSRVRTSEQDSTDINLIMDRFNRTGKLPAMQTKNPQYGDARAVPYDVALNIVKSAKEDFMSLPATTRKVFDNDPAQLEIFLADPNNNERAVALGLKEIPKPSAEQLLIEVAKNTKKVEAKENL